MDFEETFHQSEYKKEIVVAWSSILFVVFRILLGAHLVAFSADRFQFLTIPYVVLPFVGAIAAYWSRRMNGSVLERIVSALFPVFAFVALFAVRIVYGLFFEGKPYTLAHFLAGFSVTLVSIVVGGLLLGTAHMRHSAARTLENSCPDNRAASTGNIGRLAVGPRQHATEPTPSGPCSNRPSARAVARMGAAGRGPIRGPS